MKNNNFNNEIYRLNEISKHFNINMIDYNYFYELSDYSTVQQIVNELRYKIIKINSEKSAYRMKSPEFNKGQESSYSYFSYERGYVPYTLERLLKSSYNSKNVFSAITRSGMTSIDLAIRVASFFINKDQINLVSYHSYFETSALFSFYKREKFINIKISNNFDDFIEMLINNDADIIFIEHMFSIPFEDEYSENRLIDALNNLGMKKLRFLIFDSTMSGILKNLTFFMKKISSQFIILDVSSGLKFYNVGLELSNLGLINIWSNYSNVSKKILDQIKFLRSLTGQSIQPLEETLLYPIFKNLNIVSEHYNAILKNSEIYQKKFFESNLITNVYTSPIIILKNRQNKGTQIQKIVHNIHDKCLKNNIRLSTGDSFGFHLPRIQAIHTKDGNHFIRVSPGSLFSSVDDLIIEILIEEFRI